MSIIGEFVRSENGVFMGEIRTLALHTKLALRPNEQRTQDQQPAYRVFARNRIEIGAAWWKKPDNGAADYLSVSIDDPSLAKPINAILARSRDEELDEEVWNLIWNRPPAPKD